MNDTTPTWQTAARRLVLTFVFLLLWLSLLRFPTTMPTGALDPSWNAVLSWAALEGKQAGTDYVFHSGPLGWIYSTAYLPDIYVVRVVADVLLTAILAFVLIECRTLLPRRLRPLFLLALLLATTLLKIRLPDPFHLLAAMLVGLTLCRRARPSPLFVSAGTLLLAALSLIKITLFLYCSLVLIVAVACILVTERAFRRPALIVGSFAFFWLLLYLGMGQSLSAIPRYMRGALEVSAGYAEAMGLGGRGWAEPALAALMLLLWGSAEALGCFRRPLRIWPIARSVLVGTAAFLAWKHGFVRHDVHACLFFTFAALAPFFSWPAADVTGRVRLLRVAPLIAALCLSNVILFSSYPAETRGGRPVDLLRRLPPCANLDLLRRFDERRGRLDLRLRRTAAELALPRISEKVGSAPVDILSYSQGLLFLNRLNYHPRPVFQSYIAYTDYLLRENERYFAGQDAPRYVIYRPQPIDFRLPPIEDGPALKQILRRYHPVLEEDGFLLLERVGDGVPAREKLLQEIRVAWGETVDLSGLGNRFISVSIDVRFSPLGRIVTLLLRPPTLFVRLRGPSWEKRYRIVPRLMREGFLLQPLVRSAEDLSECYRIANAEGVPDIPPELRVDSLEIEEGEPWTHRLLEPEIRIRVSEIPGETVARAPPR